MQVCTKDEQTTNTFPPVRRPDNRATRCFWIKIVQNETKNFFCYNLYITLSQISNKLQKSKIKKLPYWQKIAQ
jgi:hypothetical protein